MTIEQLLEVVASLKQSDSGEIITALKGEDEQWKKNAPEVFKEMLLDFRKAHGVEQLDRGVRETATKFEKLLRSGLGDIYDLPKKAKGEALVTALKERIKTDQDRFTQLSAMTEGKEGELTLEDLVKRDDVREYLAGKIAEGSKGYQTQADEWKDKYESKEREMANYEKRAIIKSYIDSLSKDMSIVFDWDGNKELIPERKQRLYDAKEFDPDGFILEGGVPVPVDAEGNPLYDDKTSQKVGFNDVFSRVAPIMFPVKKYDSNPTPVPEEGGKGGKYHFRNIDDYLAKTKVVTDPAQKREMAEAWSAQQS